MKTDKTYEEAMKTPKQERAERTAKQLTEQHGVPYEALKTSKGWAIRVK